MSRLDTGFELLAGSAVATFGQSRALADSWMPAGPAGVPLALRSGPYVSAAVHGIFFFVMVMIGFRDWHRESRARIARDPRPEAVPV